MTALSVAYRQLPSAPLAVSMADHHAYTWLIDQGHPPDRIVIAGDSAGGFLAFTTALAARDNNQPTPAGIVALSPACRRSCYRPGERKPCSTTPTSDLLANRLAAAGVAHRLQIWDRQPHVFQAFAGAIPEGHVALDHIATFIRSVDTTGEAAA